MYRVPLRKKRLNPFALPRRNGRPPSKLIEDGLSVQERIFVEQYCIDFNASRAARAAGISKDLAGHVSNEWLKRTRVLLAINQARQETSVRLQINADDVAQYWWDLATADARELNPVLRGSCRYCWGVEHQYQYTENEWRIALRKHLVAQLKLPPASRRELDMLGGTGYNSTRDPHPECTECNGKGILVVSPLAIDNLSRGAALLFDGIKYTRDGGIEIKLRDRTKAMENFQDLLGFRRTRKPLDVFNPDEMTDEQLDAVLFEASEKGIIDATDISESRQLMLIEDKK